jgi:hypothetical protein
MSPFPRRSFGVKLDRGSMRGAKRYIVTERFEMIDHALAKAQGITGTFFQSGAEAKRWIALNLMLRAGHIRNLRRQVRYPLHVVNGAGLKVKLGAYTADHVFEERHARTPDNINPEPYTWVEVVEDVKPSGGHREDLYLWKRQHIEAEYGFKLAEWTGRR